NEHYREEEHTREDNLLSLLSCCPPQRPVASVTMQIENYRIPIHSHPPHFLEDKAIQLECSHKVEDLQIARDRGEICSC
ncbi:hypothetical protein PMAYCL1PPCAC_15965, partial [Pristionchus mayeri]